MRTLRNKEFCKRHLLSAIFLLMILVFCGCSSNSVSNESEPVPTENNLNITETKNDEKATKQISEADIQGNWGYYSQEQGYTEQILFEDGIATCSSVSDAVPDNVYTCVAEYTIHPDYISLYFKKNDFTSRLEYTWMGNELVLYVYIDSGADKGNTRIYTKLNGDITIHPTNKQADTSRKETRKKETQESVSSGMRNALKSAKNYLSVMAFSYSGLVEQLEYEGYSNSEATYAADNCGADWYEQAVKSAKQYLDVMAFSRSGLIDQLEYEGYTHDQAVYGVDKAY